eukprot:m.218244 g.218244  ORF g.218244 m.218244 type:complete len:947 (+) comp17217_c0_seq3:2423-5263(+)
MNHCKINSKFQEASDACCLPLITSWAFIVSLTNMKLPLLAYLCGATFGSLVLDNKPAITDSSVNNACEAQFGQDGFRFVPANEGFYVGDLTAIFGESEVDGVRIVKGQGVQCKAQRLRPCSLSDDGCGQIANCKDLNQNETGCLTCVKDVFRSFKIITRTRIYADCKKGTLPIGQARRKHRKGVLKALKSVIVDQCHLKGCPYWTEKINRVRVRGNSKRLGIPTRSKKAKAKLQDCVALQAVQFADNGCRFSINQLPAYTAPPPPPPEPSCTNTFRRVCSVGTFDTGDANETSTSPIPVVDCADLSLDDVPCSPLPTAVQHVFLNNNSLVSIPPIFDGLANLTELDLSNNDLTQLPDGLFDDVNPNITIALANNPWFCCGYTREALLGASDGPLCAGPSDVQGQPPPSNESIGCNPPVLTLLNATAFNQLSGNLVFELSGDYFFDLDPDTVNLTVGGSEVANVSVEDSTITAAVFLFPGLNLIELDALTTIGVAVNLSTTILAGGSTVTVELFDEDGNVYNGTAVVSITSADDSLLAVSATTSTGSVDFLDMPTRTLLISASGDDGTFGTASSVGGNTAYITMFGFGNVSSISNNNFTQGLEGWVVPPLGGASLVPHVEDVGPGTGGNVSAGGGSDAPQPSSRHTRALNDTDMAVSTNGIEGETRVSRTIASEANQVGVRVRYRFVTTEVPGGYFGSQFNDYFSVTIRSRGNESLQIPGKVFAESNSMNALGLAAFDSQGSTAWREHNLPLACSGDVIQVDIAVANVADGALDSFVYVDFMALSSLEELPSCTNPEPIETGLAVGPWDAVKACLSAKTADDAAYSTDFTGTSNGKHDAMRHCAWNCLMTRSIGADQAKKVGDLHEACRKNMCEETAMDLHNNMIGRELGLHDPGPCAEACESAVARGKTQNDLAAKDPVARRRASADEIWSWFNIEKCTLNLFTLI